MTQGIGFGMDVSVDIDNVIYENLRELEFVLGREFASWFLGVEMTQYLQRRAELRFRKEGALPGEKGWKNLAEFTVAERESLGYPGAHPINRRTGELEEWVTNANATVRGAEGLMELEWPGNMPSDSETREKFETAQRGKTSPRFTPARPVVRLSAVDMVHVMAAFAGHTKAAGVTFDGN